VKVIIGITLCLLLMPTLSWAVSDRDSECLVADLSKAIEEYRALDQGPSLYDVVLMRDPMQALVDEDGKIVNPAGLHTGLAVQGIIRSKNFKSIMVDNVLYSVGDMVGSYRVLEIRENGFLAGDDGKKIFIPLYSEDSTQANSEGSAPQ